jgi:hypothetical protein
MKNKIFLYKKEELKKVFIHFIIFFSEFFKFIFLGEKFYVDRCSITKEISIIVSLEPFKESTHQKINIPIYITSEKQPENIKLTDQNGNVIEISLVHKNLGAKSKIISFFTKFWIRNETKMKLALSESKAKKILKLKSGNSLIPGQNFVSMKKENKNNDPSLFFDDSFTNSDILFNGSKFNFQIWDSSASKTIDLHNIESTYSEEFEVKRSDGGVFNVCIDSYTAPKQFWRTKVIK